jgi:hypothetical protein
MNKKSKKQRTNVKTRLKDLCIEKPNGLINYPGGSAVDKQSKMVSILNSIKNEVIITNIEHFLSL